MLPRSPHEDRYVVGECECDEGRTCDSARRVWRSGTVGSLRGLRGFHDDHKGEGATKRKRRMGEGEKGRSLKIMKHVDATGDVLHVEVFRGAVRATRPQPHCSSRKRGEPFPALLLFSLLSLRGVGECIFSDLHVMLFPSRSIEIVVALPRKFPTCVSLPEKELFPDEKGTRIDAYSSLRTSTPDLPFQRQAIECNSYPKTERS